MRKLIIGLIAVGFVASLFWVYALIMDPAPIQVQKVEEDDNLEMPELGDAAQQTGQADVRVAKVARYTAFDPETGEPKRVFGFDKLLNPDMDTSRKEVEKPFLIFYDSDYQCRIDADMGILQIESSGSNFMPKDARLNGNVQIHIIPRSGSKISETTVEMDDLEFSSERSEFATDHKVYIRSDQVELKGTGLVIIVDPANGIINYLRIQDLEEIRMREVMEPKSGRKTANAGKAPGKKSERRRAAGQDADSVIEDGSAEKTPSMKYYHCLLEDNVKIEYGDEIIVSAAEQVNIQNILFSKLDQNPKAKQASDQVKNRPKTVAKSGLPTDKNVKAGQDIDSEREILVTCDGGIILKPMQNESAEQAAVAQPMSMKEMGNFPLRVAKITPKTRQQIPTVQMANLTGEKDTSATSETTKELPVADNTVLEAVSDSNDSPPAKFEAQKIDYDLLTGSGLAHGPVQFTFYQPPDPNATTQKTWIPIIVTADEEAQFIAGTSQTIKQVVFKGNVMTTRESSTPDFLQLDKLHSEKLTVDLDEIQAGEVDLSRLSVTEGRVYIESQRTQEDRELSKVKLYCTKILYDKVGDVILAEGPGKIEMVNNERSQAVGTDPNNPMNRPCVAMVDSFKEIRWDMSKQSIIADGDQDTMKLAYYPILDGLIQKQIFAYSMQLQMSYLPGVGEVKKVFTDKSIIYEEWNSDMTKREHYVVGQTLDYDAVKGNGWMKIEGTPAVPCNVDGARMPEVFVHPVTGEIKASISTVPGVLKGR